MTHLRSHSIALLLFSFLVIFSANILAAPVLTVGETDSSKYGYGYNGISTNQVVAEFDFSQSQDNLLLSLIAFDIDTTMEIAVQLNGSTIGHLPKSANNGTVTAEFSIAQLQQIPGLNRLRFVQSSPGWRWGITNLSLEPETVTSTNPVLQLGINDANKYGNYFFGVSNYPASVSFDIPASNQGFTLSVVNFDIDTVNEVAVHVNGQFIQHLSKTPNNGYTADTLTIPASQLNPNGNVLSFTQNNPGWRWGVTNLVLTQNTAYPLSIDVLNNDLFGFGFNGINTNQETAEFVFNTQGTDLALSVDTYDIDTANEVSIQLNGQTVGYLNKTGNNSLGSTTMLLPASSQTSGANTLIFSQSTSGWTWGITNILLTTSGATRLTPDVAHNESYGYAYFGLNSNPDNAEFVFTGTDRNLNLKLTGFDIDIKDEVAIELNGSVIGHLAKTTNNAEGPTEFLIPSHLQIVGDNALIFRQKNINWRWGIKNLLLQTQAALVPTLSDYELVFADEFNTGSLDASKWNTGMLWGPYLAINSEQQLYVDSLGINQNFSHSPFSFSADTLTISATPTSVHRFGITTLNTSTTDPTATTRVTNLAMSIIFRAS